MHELEISDDVSAFAVHAVLDDKGKLTADCARQALASMDEHGLVILTGLLSDAQADVGAELIRRTIADPDRNQCAFASETDNRYRRRDFCSIPSTPPVTGFAARLCQSLEAVLSAYCDRSHPLLEVTTLTSYFGSSHQYIHRDPSSVISLFVAVEDVSGQQGGTVFVPGTHLGNGVATRHDSNSRELMELFRIRCNYGVFFYNLKKLWGMRSEKGLLAPGEFTDRVFSRKWDEHQPNLLRFALGKNSQFSLRMFTPKILWKLYRHREALGRFHLVRTAPRKGTVIVYQSDLLHAGPDNRSRQPRRLLGMSIARDVIETKLWHAGYSPHPTLTANPLSFGDLLDAPLDAPPGVQTHMHASVS